MNLPSTSVGLRLGGLPAVTNGLTFLVPFFPLRGDNFTAQPPRKLPVQDWMLVR